MREWKDKLKTMKHYDAQASIYNVQYLEEQEDKIKEILGNMKLEPNEVVLDLGCGTGFLFSHVIGKVKLLVGVDLSRKALQEAKNRAKKIPNTVLVCADADYTPFINNVFDKIFAVTVLQNMPSPEKTLREMKRIGKPEAVFAVTGLKKSFTQEGFIELLERTHLKAHHIYTNDRMKGYVAVCSSQKGEEN